MVRISDEILYRPQDSHISDADYSIFKVLKSFYALIPELRFLTEQICVDYQFFFHQLLLLFRKIKKDHPVHHHLKFVISDKTVFQIRLLFYCTEAGIF